MPIHKFVNDLEKIMILVVFICLILCTIRIYLKKKKLNWPNYNKKQPCFSAAPLNCPNLWFVRRNFFSIYNALQCSNSENIKPEMEKRATPIQWERERCVAMDECLAFYCNALQFTATHCNASQCNGWVQEIMIAASYAGKESCKNPRPGNCMPPQFGIGIKATD